MTLFDNRHLLTILLTVMTIFSCTQPLKSNQFNIYISKDETGWHFVDLTQDTIHKGYQKIEVKFSKNQAFQTATIGFNVDSCLPVFLYSNGDTIKSQLWFVGTYTYDPIPKTFVSFYVPTDAQQKTIKDYMNDSNYYWREQMDTLVRDYLSRQNKIK